MIESKNDNGFGIAPLCDWSRCLSTGGAKKGVNSGVFDKKRLFSVISTQSILLFKEIQLSLLCNFYTKELWI